MNKTLGIILIVLGLEGLVWGGFTYSMKEKVVDNGAIHVSRDQTNNIPLPLIGGVMLIGGIALLVANSKRRNPPSRTALKD